VVGYRKNTAELFVILGVVQESETAKQQVELAHDIDHTQSYAFQTKHESLLSSNPVSHRQISSATATHE
jgi:hypothetical protein